LLQNEFIQIGKHRRVKTDAVFNQQDQLHSHFRHIMLQIHFIFYQLDDGHQQIRIAQPAEHIVERTQILIGNTRRNAMTERGKNHDRNMLVQALDMPPDVKTVIITRARHTDNEIERHVLKQRQCLFFCRNLRKARGITKGKRGIFIEDLFIDAPVILKHKCVVRISNQQNIEYTPRHQIGKLRIFEIKLV